MLGSSHVFISNNYWDGLPQLTLDIRSIFVTQRGRGRERREEREGGRRGGRERGGGGREGVREERERE